MSVSIILLCLSDQRHRQTVPPGLLQGPGKGEEHRPGEHCLLPGRHSLLCHDGPQELPHREGSHPGRQRGQKGTAGPIQHRQAEATPVCHRCCPGLVTNSILFY